MRPRVAPLDARPHTWQPSGVKRDSGWNTAARARPRLRRGATFAMLASVVACGLARERDPSGGASDAVPGTALASSTPSGALDARTVPESTSMSMSTPDAGSPSVCAPPRASSSSQQPEATWARNPETGDCCLYDRPSAPPLAWSRFKSRAECETSCRCAERTSSPEWSALTDFPQTERISLECACGVMSCPASLADALAARCAIYDRAELQRGCGKIYLLDSGGYSYSVTVFDERTGALIGVGWGSDSPDAPCMTVDTVGGEPFDCPDAVTCAACAGAPDAGPCQ